jgi:FlgD Ig-like domain
MKRIYLLFILAIFSSYSVFSQVSITPANNGTNLPRSTSCANGTPGGYVQLNNIVISESTVSDFSGTTPQLVLNPPSGWQFLAGVGGASPNAGNDITYIDITITASQISITLHQTTTTKYDQVTISGLQVQAIDGNNSSNYTPQHIYASSVSNISGITTGSGSSGTNFGNLSLDSGTPLPAELISLSASVSGNVVNLKWSTSTEVNNYGFDVERSVDNKTWTKVGFVAGAGNSNSPKNYSFTDQPNGGTSFSYRLKQIDVGGVYKYYDPITVSLTGGDKAQLMQNSPNPFNPSTVIKYYVPQAVDVTITIYDILGREVTKLVNSQVEAGYHVVYWNGRDRFGNAAASGVYIYRLTAGNFTEIKKMNLLK